MWIPVAALTMAGVFASALAAVLAARRRPLALAALLAFAGTVVFEAVLLDVLSLFQLVTRGGVLAGHALAIAAAVAAGLAVGARRSHARAAGRRAVFAVRALGWPGLVVAALAAVLLVSAVRFLPSNWDSMTYHLARVAHWIQNRSVEPYPTHVSRQVMYQPGGEYLLASVQVIAGSDRLANLVQLCAWVLVVLAAPALARLAGAPRRLAPWAAVIVAALPMGVLQATSTQNDLVAAALGLAVISAAVPFLHRRARWRTSDAVLLGVALAAAALVKATALVAAAPFLVVAVVRSVSAGRERPLRAVVAVLVAAGIAAAVLAPEVVRRRSEALAPEMSTHSSLFLYSGVRDVGDRLLNLGRGIVRHVPVPPALVSAVGIATESWCRPGASTCGAVLLRAHEDLAGNPLHVAIVVLAAAVALARWRRLPPRAVLFLSGTAAAWFLFHFTFRDNTWISRLETPTYVLTGLAVAAWGTRRAPAAPAPRAGRARGRAHAGRTPRVPVVAMAAVALVALAFGANVALANDTRPPLRRRGSPAHLGYYVNQPQTGRAHDAVLRAAALWRCERIGLYIGSDTYDYPLTWRAMQQGIAVRHVFGRDPWPCLVFTDRGGPALAAFGWTPTALPFLYGNGGGVGAVAEQPAPRER